MSMCVLFPTTLVVLVIAFSPLSGADVAQSKYVGVNFLNGQWSSFPYTSSPAATSLSLLSNTTGSNCVMLSFAWFQPSIYVPGPIYNKSSTPSDQDLVSAVASASAIGITPVLRPLIDPDWANASNAGTWRGEIGARFSFSDWKIWFAAYSKVALKYASLSQSLGLPMYCVGAELVQASHQAEEWRDLLAAVRLVYSGSIMYAANHGNELFVQWWDDSNLDIIGIDAYYTLFVPGVYPPAVSQVMEAWDVVKTELEILSKSVDKPVFFAEIGYCSVPEPWIDPAHCLDHAPVDLEAQALAYDAVLSVFLPLPWFAGITFWDWATAENGRFSGSEAGFSPANKPATLVMAKHTHSLKH